VLVKFTANWCSTCQVIEGTVYRNPTVWNYLHQSHIVTIKADLSRENPEASAVLDQLDVSGGIPLTAIYPPGANQPIKISGIYSTDTLLKTLRSILPPQP
jgi:thiol:disulfide interchange protein